MAAESVVLPCRSCGRDVPFEPPPCADGHEDDCPELACTGCGAAVFVAGWAGADRAVAPVGVVAA